MSEDTPPVRDLRDHMKRTHQTALYPFAGLANVQGLMYIGLGIAGEAGEIANQVKKIARDNGGMVTSDRRDKILDELGDVMWYWLRFCHELGFDPYEVLEHNEKKLTERASNGTIHGDRRGGLVRQASQEWEADMAEAAGKEDVFGVPLEGYQKFIRLTTLRSEYRLVCESLRCVQWSRSFVFGTGADAIRQEAMAHVMAEHTPWGRAGRE
jgi:NTP pyrophosphatase (non-canonical NTP hydrolase)